VVREDTVVGGEVGPLGLPSVRLSHYSWATGRTWRPAAGRIVAWKGRNLESELGDEMRLSPETRRGG
jgi:hypothetical protein